MRRRTLAELQAKMETRSPGITSRLPEILADLDADEARRRLALAPIRKARGKTQGEVAERLGVKQPEISQLEQRSDTSLSTLQSYVEALGGRLEVVAVFDDERFTVLPEPDVISVKLAS